jgi:UDP-glucuronate 4-epimerase
VIGCLDNPPSATTSPPHRLYNIGNDRSESLKDFLHTLETIIGKKAQIQLEALQPGDVKETIADIRETKKAFGFEPKTQIHEGLTAFVNWYKEFYGREHSDETL